MHAWVFSGYSSFLSVQKLMFFLAKWSKWHFDHLFAHWPVDVCVTCLLVGLISWKFLKFMVIRPFRTSRCCSNHIDLHKALALIPFCNPNSKLRPNDHRYELAIKGSRCPHDGFFVVVVGFIVMNTTQETNKFQLSVPRFTLISNQIQYMEGQSAAWLWLGV